MEFWNNGILEYWNTGPTACRKTFSESFDWAQDERRRFDIINVFPFMLRHSKHS
jgi:hypothetical protein